MSKYEFKYNCINPESLDELEVVIDDLENDILFDEFIKSIPFKDINYALGDVYNDEEQMRSDWHVRFYIGSVEFEDETINYAVIVWSATEFVWKLN